LLLRCFSVFFKAMPLARMSKQALPPAHVQALEIGVANGG
jgi:hypothetical protein